MTCAPVFPASTPVGRFVDDEVTVIASPEAVTTPQGGFAVRGITRERVGARNLCLSRLEIPPGLVENAHYHAEHETAIYIVSGEVEVRHGPRLASTVVARAGDFVYIPPSVAHQPINRSLTETVVVLLARTDPHDIESLVLL